MKRVTYTLLAVMMVITATTLPAAAQSTESRQVSGFTRIECGEVLNVHVKIDGTESLKISSSADVIRVIETVVEHGTLKIKFKDHLKNGEGEANGPLDIYVTAKSLSSVVKEGSGSIDIDGTVTGRDVSIILNGSGNVKASVKSENLKVTLNLSGNIYLSGMADKAKIMINGPGQVDGQDLKTKDASVKITGAGSAYLSAEKTISAKINGPGGVVYSGNATVIDSEKAVGTGGIKKAK